MVSQNEASGASHSFGNATLGHDESRPPLLNLVIKYQKHSKGASAMIKEKEDFELIKVDEVARMLNIKLKTVYQNKENIPGFRQIGEKGSIRFLKSQVLDFIRNGKKLSHKE